MKQIKTLTQDIYKVLDVTVEHQPDADIAADYAMRIGGEFAKATLKRDKPREMGTLWASDIGKKCHRQLWYKWHMPEKEEPLLGHTKFKFLYGNILEEAVLYMAEEAGHTVEHQQERVKAVVHDWEITGKIDCTIDGVLVDVKSTSSYGFTRYKHGINPSNDSFGYLGQLGFYQGYGTFERSDKEQGFVWIDKQNGHIQYTPAVIQPEPDIRATATAIIQSLEQTGVDSVARGYVPEPYGKSGNECLPTGCSYCPFKGECWKDSNGGKGLRTFAYNHKPVHFTKIVREPKVQEITNE